jgi:hypothetical protein
VLHRSNHLTNRNTTLDTLQDVLLYELTIFKLFSHDDGVPVDASVSNILLTNDNV